MTMKKIKKEDEEDNEGGSEGGGSAEREGGGEGEKGGGGLSYSRDYGIIWEYLSEEESDFIFDEIFEKQVYLRNGITITDGSTIVDVGANIGLFSLFCIQQSKNLNILCIEPLPPNFNTLKRNLSDYARKSNTNYNIKFLDCGVGNIPEEGSLTEFYFIPGNPGESTRHPEEQSNQRNILLESAMSCGIEEIRDVAVQQMKSGCVYSIDSSKNNDNNYPKEERITEEDSKSREKEAKTDALPSSNSAHRPQVYSCLLKSLEQIITEHSITSIDLIKIDVEGDEINALKGIEGKWGMIRQVILEVHDIEGRLNEALRLLADQGFSTVVEKQQSEISPTDYSSFIPKELELYLVYAVRNDTECKGIDGGQRKKRG